MKIEHIYRITTKIQTQFDSLYSLGHPIPQALQAMIPERRGRINQSPARCGWETNQ